MKFSFGEYLLDTESRSLRRSGQPVHVEPKVFDLLTYLVEHRERVVSTAELFEAHWPGVNVGPAALSRAVHKIREAVGDDGENQTVLRTEYGRGFRFIADVTVVSATETARPTPSRVKSRLAALAVAAALLLVSATVWLLIRPLTESAPARSVAVLPFENTSEDPATEPFANGIYDDILTQIARIHDLKVIARTTMEQLDANLGVQQIGTELGVAAVLEGGVQRAGNRVRINVQLIDCKSDAHLWAETYDRELTATNVFAIQSEIARSVADALRATLSEDEQDRLATVPTQNLAAYDAYLLGKQRMAKRTIVAFPQAIEYFQQAIEHDPSFALAYVGLADSYRLQFEYADRPLDETLAKARVAADKALELDPRLPEVYTSLAGVSHMRGDFEVAEREFLKALKLSPGYGQAHHWYGVLLREGLDRPQEALSMFLRAAELDPLSALVMTNVGAALGSLGQFEEALAWYERSLELDPTMVVNVQDIGRYHLNVTGKLDQAIAWYLRAASLDPASPRYPATLTLIFLTLGDPATATYWSDQAIELGPDSILPKIAELSLHLYQNDESVLMYARKAFSDITSYSPGFDGLPLLVLRNHHLSAGRYGEARALYEGVRPELFNDGDPHVNFRNWNAAIELAAVLFKTGEQERANLLLEKSLQQIKSKPRLGDNGYRLADVKIFAMRGDKQNALSALQQAIDEGWRASWWYDLRYDPILEPLHDEPEFQAMVTEIEADMAAQLTRVREMERNGELAAIPRDHASVQ